MNKIKENFKYVVIAVVLLIPFIYSFFYLKAYWDPYGKGNIDNIPVAIVNKDKGENGTKIINSIKDSGKLKVKVLSSDKAEEGLDSGKYYAVIKIPSDFSSSMESISTNNKKHPTITYSPNQKSSFLASQIINSVVNAVEKKLDNQVNSEIVGSLSNNLEEVPDKLDTISDGFSKLKDGTSELSSGGKKIKSGTDELYSGVSSIRDNLASSINGLDPNLTEEEKSQILSTITSSEELSNANIEAAAMAGLQSNQSYISLKNQYNTGIDNYNTGLNQYNTAVGQLIGSGLITETEYNECLSGITTGVCANTMVAALVNSKKTLDSSKASLDSLAQVIDAIELTAKQTAKQTANLVAQKVALQTAASVKLNATNKTKDSLNTLLTYIDKVNTGTYQLKQGTNTLNNGLTTLDNSVGSSKEELTSKINSTKEDVKKVSSLKKYSKEPVKINTKEVNKISKYGTAFSPLFISIGLWVGCLMMFMVFYYDKNERFKILGINNKNRIQRMLAYHGLITVSSFILGLLLLIFLDFEIQSVFLYFISIILIGNMFMALIEFLIENFNDIGKFIALIILILQLAASGGTFPIETVTKGFRFLNNLLPMTYTIRLLKEPLVSIESALVTKNMVVVFIILIVFAGINLILNINKQKKEA